MIWKSGKDKDEAVPDPGMTGGETSEEALDAASVALGAAPRHISENFGTEARTILNSIAEGVVVFTDTLRVRFANREATRLLGKIQGKELEEFVSSLTRIEDEKNEPVPPAEHPARKALREGFPIKTMVRWQRPDGEAHEVEVLATPLRNGGETTGIVMTVRNVEQQLRIERELREFIAIASHQFRTPLASISWFLEILLSGKVGELDKKQWELVQQSREAVTRLKDTIHLTLNAATTEFGALEIAPEPHDIGELLTEEVNHTQVFATRKQQKIELFLPRTMPTIPVDATILRFVVMNLLSNAVKYSREGGKITVTAVVEPRRLLIAVKDEGVGIPEADQDRIFTKFFRGGNVLMKSDGTGLGLYIVKRLLDRVGGSIWFDSKEGQGTEFTFAIPQEGFKAVAGRTKLEPLSKSVYGNT